MKPNRAVFAIAFAAAFLLASTNCYSVQPEKVSLEGEDFIFTFWPIYISGCTQQKLDDPNSIASKRMQGIDTMMDPSIGMTHAGIHFVALPTDENPCLTNLKNIKKYKLALEISAGHGRLNEGRTELADIKWPAEYLNTDKGKQFLKAPCLCNNCTITEEIANNWSDYVDKERCGDWNNNRALDPSYTGILWQNTLNNTKDVVAKAQPEIVLFDTELWLRPGAIDTDFYGDTDCQCMLLQKAFGYDGCGTQPPCNRYDYYQKNPLCCQYDRYISAWRQRGLELKAAVQSVSSAKVSFYDEIPANGRRYVQTYTGAYWDNYDTIGAMPSGVSDYPSPYLYIVPNLEVFEKNTPYLSGTVPWVSYTHMMGYSNFNEQKADVYFDPSVSREAGRMLREAGAKGFIVYPNGQNMEERTAGEKYWQHYGKQGYDYWLAHAKEMIAGFNEEPTYVEKNKIRNSDFEAFRAVTKEYKKGAGMSHTSSQLVGQTQFAPVFWFWQDSSPNYNDINNAAFSNLVYDDSLQEYLKVPDAQPYKNFVFADVKSGSVAWKHSRNGEPGSRTILSKTFSIGAAEEGKYKFSIWTKASLDSANGKIEFFLVNTSTLAEQKLGETGFETSWKEFKKYANMAVGDYNVKILINDQTGQAIDIFLDKASLEKAGEECGNTICEAGETVSCPQDCQECIDTPKLIGYISQWKRGEISMLTLMQKMKQYKAGTGCPTQ